MKVLYLSIIIILGTLHVSSQQISVAPEINIQNDKMFAVIGQVDNKILTFRNNNKKFILNIFDTKLNRYTEKNIKFEKKNIKILSITNSQKDWVVVYSFFRKNNEIINAYRFDNVGNRIDSIHILTQKKHFTTKSFLYSESENEKQLLLFRKIDKSSMEFLAIDLDLIKITFFKEVKFNNLSLHSDFRKAIITNKGEIFIVFNRKSNIFNRKKERIIVHHLHIDDINNNFVEIELNSQTSSIKSVFDNANNILNISGTISKSFSNKSKGYYLIKLNNDLSLNNKIENHFSNKFLSDYYKLKNKRKRKYIRDFELKELLLRNDGGSLLIFEKKEIISRHNSSLQYRNRSFNNNTDYLYGEIAIQSLHNDGEEFWSKIMPKNQISTNDQGIYSSFFIFKNPSLIKIIFNDEIKHENQIIMYSFNTLGNYKRKALFSTDLFNLNLALTKSLQITNTRFIVPSYKKDKLKLVMIDFNTK